MAGCDFQLYRARRQHHRQRRVRVDDHAQAAAEVGARNLDGASSIAGNPKAAQDYRGGKEEAIKFLVGQVMKETRGRARPEDVTAILKEKLNKEP